MRKLHTPGKGIPALAAGPIIGAGIAAAALFLTISAKAAKADAKENDAEQLGSVSEASDEISFSDGLFGESGTSLFDSAESFGNDNRDFHIPWISGAGSGASDSDYAGNSIYSAGSNAARSASSGSGQTERTAGTSSGDSGSTTNIHVSPSQPGGYVTGTSSSPVIHITPSSGNGNSSVTPAASSAASEASSAARAQELQQKIDSISAALQREESASQQAKKDTAEYAKTLSELTGQLNDLKRQLSENAMPSAQPELQRSYGELLDRMEDLIKDAKKAEKNSSDSSTPDVSQKIYEMQLESLKQQISDMRIANEKEIRRLERENDELKDTIRDVSSRPAQGGNGNSGTGNSGSATGGNQNSDGSENGTNTPGKGTPETEPEVPAEEPRTIVSGSTGNEDEAPSDTSGTAYPVEVYTNESNIITTSLKDLYTEYTADKKTGVAFTYDNPDPLYCATDPTASKYALFVYGTKDSPVLCGTKEKVSAPAFEFSDKWTFLGIFRSGKKDGETYSAEYFTSNLLASTDTTAGALYKGSSTDDACRTFVALVPMKTWQTVEAAGEGTALPDGTGNYTMKVFSNGAPYNDVKVMDLYSLSSDENNDLFTTNSESSRYALYVYGTKDGFTKVSEAPVFNAKSTSWLPLGRFSSGLLDRSTGDDPAGWLRSASYYLSTTGQAAGSTESVLPDDSKKCFIALVPMCCPRAVVKAQGQGTGNYEMSVYPDGDRERDVIITDLNGLNNSYSAFDDVMSNASITARDSSDARYALFVYGTDADSSNLVDTASEMPHFDLQNWTCLGRFRNAENGQANFFTNGVNGYMYSRTGGEATAESPEELWFALVPLENYTNVITGQVSEATYQSLDLYANGYLGNPVRVTTLANLYDNMNEAPFKADSSENAKYALFLYDGLSEKVPVFDADAKDWQLIGRYQGRGGSTTGYSAKYFTSLSGNSVKSLKAVSPENAVKTYVALVPLKNLFLDLSKTTLTVGQNTDTAHGSVSAIRKDIPSLDVSGETLSCSADTTAERYGFSILDKDGSKNNILVTADNNTITAKAEGLSDDSATADTALIGQDGQVYTSSFLNVNTMEAAVTFTGGNGTINASLGSLSNSVTISEGSLTLRIPRNSTVALSTACNKSDSTAGIKGNRSFSVSAAVPATVTATCAIPVSSEDPSARTVTVTAKITGTDKAVITVDASFTWSPAEKAVAYTGKKLKSTTIASAINQYANLGSHYSITYQTHTGSCGTPPNLYWNDGTVTTKTPSGSGFHADVGSEYKYYGTNQTLRLTTYPVTLFVDDRSIQQFGGGGCQENNKYCTTWENTVDITITRLW